jgi:hypothetical protein
MTATDNFREGPPGTTVVKEGRGFAVGQTTSLPECNATRRFEERAVPGGAGADDVKYICQRDAAGVWAWTSGGGGGGGVGPAGPAGATGATGPTGPGSSLVFSVTTYGALGDGSTDDTIAIQATIDAAEVHSGIVWFPPGTYKTTAALVLGTSNVTLQGAGESSVITPVYANSDNNSAAIVSVGGSTAADFLAVNGNEGDRTITLAAGAVSARPYVVGDMVQLIENSSSGLQQMALVQGIAGDVLTLSDPLYEPFLTSATAEAHRLTPRTGLMIRDLAIDGSGMTGTARRGILLDRTLGAKVIGVTASHFPENGICLRRGYHTVVEDARLIVCGVGSDDTGASAAAIHCDRQTGLVADGIRAERSSGFGPQFVNCNGCAVSNVRSAYTNNRGLKINFTSYSTFVNLEIVSPTKTGLSLAGGSHDNRISNVVVRSSGESGLWFAAQAEHDNTLINVSSVAAGDYGLHFGSVTNYNNRVIGQMEENGYISSKKAFVGLRPKTTYRMAPEGRKALAGYIKAMRQVLDALEPSDRSK